MFNCRSDIRSDEPMPGFLVRIARTPGIFLLAAAISSSGGAVRAQGAPPSPFNGRWVIPADPWFDRVATASGQGRGARGAGGRGEQAPGKDVMLELEVSPSGAISGRATGTSGRRGAPGSHPAHDVEITRGSLKGDTLTFQVWQFDGFHNRIHATARVADGSLELELRRDTPAGPDSFTTRARRAGY
jgi:hypothetical protein